MTKREIFGFALAGLALAVCVLALPWPASGITFVLAGALILSVFR